jgi:hypothetical protein
MSKNTCLCPVIPPHMLRNVAQHADDGALRRSATTTLDQMQVVASGRGRPLIALARAGNAPQKRRNVYDAQHKRKLPGKPARAEGKKPVSDVEVNEAYDGTGAVYDFYLRVLGRNSIDGNGLPLVSTVHYGRNFDNALWNGKQMVFGDGDGKLFNRFTAAPDVIGHELTHGVTQSTAGLAYSGQTGALNEHVSDVFGILVKHFLLGQPAAEADWIIGEGLLAPGVRGQGIRSMSAPGTAYNDPVLGKDPQPAHMRDYKHTVADNGGVHINSGIPNHAFYLAAVWIGGYAWEVAGQIWYAALTTKVSANAQFGDFADATVMVAGEMFGTATQRAVADAWRQVGVPLTVKLPGRNRGVGHFQLIPTNDETKGEVMFKNFQNEHAAASQMYGAVDSSMQQWVDFDEIAQPGKATVKTESPVEHAVSVYQSIRPLLSGLTTLWVLPPAWRTGLALLVAAFDGLAAVPGTVDPDFKAGKDL